MNTNYDLRKALYNFLDVKFDSDKQITIASGNKFKAIKVEAGSIVNLFISAENGTSANSIYLSALGKNNVNEYYSDFLIKVYWDETETIYISNDTAGDIDINSIYVEFLKGKLIETYLISSTDTMGTAKITVNSANLSRVSYKDQSLTFKSEYDTIVGNFNTFNTNYANWKATLGLYSQVDKLIPDTATETGKNKRISGYIDPSSIHSDLLIDGSILRTKLNSNVTTSLNLADSSVQSVKLNGGAELKDASENVNVNALTKLRIEDYNNSVIKEYSVNSSGEITISDWSSYMQPKLLGVTGDLLYFNGTNTISNISKDLFLLDSDIMLNAEGFALANDTKVPSSLLVKNSLDLKVNRINRTALNDISLVKVSVNNQGQVTNNTTVSQNDLTTIIGNYYLTVSYEWDAINGELKLL